MANCSICKAEVETHRYLRAEPMKTVRIQGQEVLKPVQLKVCGFYCLRHPRAEIEQHVAQDWPASDSIPIRLLWSPAPGVKTYHYFILGDNALTLNCWRCGKPAGDVVHSRGPGLGVSEKQSNTGDHCVRTIVIRDNGSLNTALKELIPDGTVWYIPHSGEPSLEEATRTLEKLFGGNDPVSEALRDKISQLGGR